MDAEINDMASAFTRVWTRDGQNTPTQDLPMGGRKFVNVGAPTSVANFMRAREFIENVPIFMQDAESSADRVSVSSLYFTSVSANQAPVDGTKIMVRVASHKSSAVLYLDGHSANIEYQDGNRIGPALVSGGIYEFTYSSVDTAWKLPKPDDGRTPAEISAGVTPVSFQYEPGNVKRYGAIGDDSTNDTTAILNAAAASRYLYFPGPYIYRLDTEISYNSTAPTHIVFGPGAQIRTIGATNRAIHITGQPAGTTSAKVIIDRANILGSNTGTADSAIFLDGVALGWIHDPVIVGSTFTAGIRGEGFQQGEISGGYIAQMVNGIHLFRDSGDDIGSNGIEIHGVSLNTTGAEILVEDTDTVFIHHNHMIGAPIGIDIYSNTNNSFARLSNNHIEGPSAGSFTAGIRLRGSNTLSAVVAGNILQGSGIDLLISAGTGLVVRDNTFSGGDVQFDSGSEIEILEGNTAVAASATTLTNNASKIVVKRGNKTSGSAFSWGDVLSPSQITANQNNYNPTGLNNAQAMRLSTDASRNITGLAGGWDQREIKIFNVGAFDIVLTADDANSTAANRFEIGASITIGPAEGVSLWYDITGARWRSGGRHN